MIKVFIRHLSCAGYTAGCYRLLLFLLFYCDFLCGQWLLWLLCWIYAALMSFVSFSGFSFICLWLFSNFTPTFVGVVTKLYHFIIGVNVWGSLAPGLIPCAITLTLGMLLFLFLSLHCAENGSKWRRCRWSNIQFMTSSLRRTLDVPIISLPSPPKNCTSLLSSLTGECGCWEH